jgi:hypothetical protein
VRNVSDASVIEQRWREWHCEDSGAAFDTDSDCFANLSKGVSTACDGTPYTKAPDAVFAASAHTLLLWLNGAALRLHPAWQAVALLRSTTLEQHASVTLVAR